MEAEGSAGPSLELTGVLRRFPLPAGPPRPRRPQDPQARPNLEAKAQNACRGHSSIAARLGRPGGQVAHAG